MRNALRILSAAALLTIGASLLLAALPFTDAFTASTGTALATYNANWTVVAQTANIQDNAASCSSGSGSCLAKDNSNTYSNDQQGTGTIKTPSGSQYAGIALRLTTGAAGYLCRVDDNEFQIYRFGTTLKLAEQASPTILTGDVMTFTIAGNVKTCTITRSSVQIYQITESSDSTYTSGSAGIGGFGSGCTTCTRIDDVTFNNYTAGGGSPTRKRAPVPMIFGTILGGVNENTADSDAGAADGGAGLWWRDGDVHRAGRY